MTNITTVSTNPINEALAKQGVTPEAIAALKTEYEAVKDIVPSTEEEYRRVISTRDQLADLRILGTKICEAGRKPAIEEQKAWIAAEKDIKAQLVPLEERLHANAKVWAEREERERLAMLQAREKAIEQRKQRLFELGFTFNGTQYVHALVPEYVLEIGDVTGDGVNDIEFGEWLSVAEGQIRMKQQEVAAADRKRRDDEAEVARIRGEQEQRERDLKAREDALLRQEQEAEAKRLRDAAEKASAQDDDDVLVWTKPEEVPVPVPVPIVTIDGQVPKTTKVYLGDSVYAEWDGYSVTLTTENGRPDDPSNTIIMELEVVTALNRFIKTLQVTT